MERTKLKFKDSEQINNSSGRNAGTYTSHIGLKLLIFFIFVLVFDLSKFLTYRMITTRQQ